MQHRTLSRVASTLGAGLLVLALIAPAADAATFAGGSTKLTLSSSFKKALSRAGIKITATAPAKVAGGRITLPITSGVATLTRGSSGNLQLGGAVTFKKGGRSLGLTKIAEVLKGSKAVLRARISGKAVDLIGQAAGKTGPAPDFASLSGSGMRASLTSKGAAALNKAFKVKSFSAGQSAGTVSFTADREIVIAPGAGNMNFKFDPATAGAFQGCGMTVEPVAPASALPPGPGAPAGTFVFPIDGGAMNARTLKGTMAHIGGIKITKPGAQSVTMTDFAFEYPPAGAAIFTVAADVLNGSRATIGDVTGPGPAVSLTATGGTLTFKDTEVRWSGAAVALLGGFYQCTTVPQGSLIGLVDATASVK